LRAQVNEVQKLAPDIYFHEGDLKGRAHCNNGWIVFDDYVLVIDGNFPSGAKEIIPKIKAIFAKSWLEQSRSGWWIQDGQGNWKRK